MQCPIWPISLDDVITVLQANKCTIPEFYAEVANGQKLTCSGALLSRSVPGTRTGPSGYRDPCVINRCILLYIVPNT